MKFQQLLSDAIDSSEIPLRFEPGATEAVAMPVTELLHRWISAHMPPDSGSEADAARAELVVRLLSELTDSADVLL